MRFNLRHSLIFAFVAGLLVLGLSACGGNKGGTLGPSNNGGNGPGSGSNSCAGVTPLSFPIWSNGAYSTGNWFNLPVSSLTQVNYGPVGAGPGSSMQVGMDATGSGIVMIMTCPVSTMHALCPAVNIPTTQIKCGGVISFDLKLERNLADYNNFQIQWGPEADCLFYKNLAPSMFNNATFTHVSIPLSSFTLSCPINRGTPPRFVFVIICAHNISWPTVACPGACVPFNCNSTCVLANQPATPLFDINNISWH